MSLGYLQVKLTNSKFRDMQIEAQPGLPDRDVRAAFGGIKVLYLVKKIRHMDADVKHVLVPEMPHSCN
jgi:hypothetical protein